MVNVQCSMKKLLSLPPNLVDSFHDVTGLSRDEYFCTNDPVGHKLGSGGGTTWLLESAWKNDWDSNLVPLYPHTPEPPSFLSWLSREKRILLHAGGQSRRLPSYAPSGKILTPVPVFRWERGQKLSQDLLSLQLPLYEQMMQTAPEHLHTMVVSGDVLVRTSQPLQPIPEADVVCYGLWLDASVAKNHGVFVSSRKSPQVLKQMLQKPSIETLNELQKDNYYLTDIGIWMLSDKAVELLAKKSRREEWGERSEITIKEYDLYSEFGCALGTEPSMPDEDLKDLKVAIVPLQGGEFYHFGTSREMISSTLKIQNLVNDQREIMHHDRKPHPSIFVQNAICKFRFTEQNTNIWIENSYVGDGWTLSHDNIITGVPENDWKIDLAPGECIDVVPIGDTEYAIRRYHIDDKFAGAEQQKKQFPVLENIELLARLENLDRLESLATRLISAEEISTEANLHRLFAQRKAFRRENWSALAENWNHSVFYQLDLADAKCEFDEQNIPLPAPLDDDAPLMTRIHDAMFRGESEKAFSLLREGLLDIDAKPLMPSLSVADDQIVWGRSPVRIDIAGGWTDTPPYCLMEGGNVINLAIELNGQPPLQTYIRQSKELRIVLRSIDLGAMEAVETSEQLKDFMHVGSPFSIPKAALVLAGFGNQMLKQELEAFGSGIEITLLSAIPAGSGLGTSSILAATVLGALNDFCGLGWDKNEIGHRTLMLEQMLTTGGGWQDQFGGVLGGVKLLQTGRGFSQNPQVRWLPTDLWTQPEYRTCHLLYYTGITRTAKSILAEIVRRMFLNHGGELRMLRQMKEHTLDMYEAIQQNDFERMGKLVRKTWIQNQLIDSGTNPEPVEALTRQVDDLCLGYKLPGAGGGGYLYMIAKDPEAAARIKQILTENSTRKNARFVDMTLSTTGLQISRS